MKQQSAAFSLRKYTVATDFTRHSEEKPTDLRHSSSSSGTWLESTQQLLVWVTFSIHSQLLVCTVPDTSLFFFFFFLGAAWTLNWEGMLRYLPCLLQHSECVRRIKEQRLDGIPTRLSSPIAASDGIRWPIAIWRSGTSTESERRDVWGKIGNKIPILILILPIKGEVGMCF